MKCRAIPYEGTEPYIFLSYSHKDAQQVYQLLEQMVRDGYRVWYDDGNHPGDDWPENIANHLHNSRVCLAMLTENASASHNCRSEISFALEIERKVMAVILEDFQMPLALRMQLSTLHRLNKREYPSESMLLQKLYETEEFKCCRAAPGSLPMWKEDKPELPVKEVQFEPAPEPKMVEAAPEEIAEQQPEPAGQIKTEISELPPEEPKSAAASEKPDDSAAEKPAQAAKKVLKVGVKAKPKKQPVNLPEPPVDAKEPDKEPKDEVKEPIEPIDSRDDLKNDEANQPQEQSGNQTASAADEDDDDGEKTVYVPHASTEEEPDPDDADDDKTVMAPRLTKALLMRLSTGKGYLITSALTSIGRSAKKCDIVLDGNSGVSNHHADIVQYKGKFCLRDAGSLNGTYVNDARLENDGEQELGSPAVFFLHNEPLVIVHGLAAREILSRNSAAIVRNVQTQETLLITESPVFLDRKHKWSNGTLDDLEIHRKAHAQIVMQEGAFYLEDRGSANGTFLNGKEMTASKPSLLKNGDQIRLGKTVLEFGFVTF